MLVINSYDHSREEKIIASWFLTYFKNKIDAINVPNLTYILRTILTLTYNAVYRETSFTINLIMEWLVQQWEVVVFGVSQMKTQFRWELLYLLSCLLMTLGTFILTVQNLTINVHIKYTFMNLAVYIVVKIYKLSTRLRLCTQKPTWHCGWLTYAVYTRPYMMF